MLGFTQSYTYFTWRNTKRELIDYFTELTQSEVTDFFRPTSMGMIDPGKSTELRSGKTDIVSGTSIGPSGAGFLEAMPRSYTRRSHFASGG